MIEENIDEILELIWMNMVKGKSSLKDIMSLSDEEDPLGIIKAMVSSGLIEVEDNVITFTKSGEERARNIIRRHRLAERLLSEIFELEDQHVESSACKFEHILSPEVTESVCTFLGHPPTCPHGKPIPKGECCKKYRMEIKPLVMRLSDLELGGEGKIVFMSPKDHSRLDRLGVLGVIPGSIIKLHQRRPSYVIEIGETMLALDEDIAKEIYVKRI
jgi:DtxR family Mn-dependent transcriptional regulator